MAGEWILKDDWDRIDGLKAEVERLRAEVTRLRERAELAERKQRAYAGLLVVPAVAPFEGKWYVTVAGIRGAPPLPMFCATWEEAIRAVDVAAARVELRAMRERLEGAAGLAAATADDPAVAGLVAAFGLPTEAATTDPAIDPETLDCPGFGASEKDPHDDSDDIPKRRP